MITPLSDLAEREGTNRKLDEKFQLSITAGLVRFRATDSDLVAFRVICQDPNTMKTQNNKLYLAAVDKRRFQFIQTNSQKV